MNLPLNAINWSKKRQHLDEQISRLSQPDGSEDPRLNALAESFAAVLLSELYDDVPIEDAPYFSALYGPARHARMVRFNRCERAIEPIGRLSGRFIFN